MLLDNVVASDFVDHLHQIKGLEAFKQTLSEIYKSFSDFSEKIKDIVTEGDKVWVRLTQTGTHTGEFHGLVPTSKKFVISSVDIFRIANGKIIEGWSVSNRLDFLKKLEIIEYTEKGKRLFQET